MIAKTMNRVDFGSIVNYDPRNEWACTLAHAAIKALREQQLYYPSSPEYSPNKSR